MVKEKIKATIKTPSGIDIKIESDRQTVVEIAAEIYRKEESRMRFREDFIRRKLFDDKRFHQIAHQRNVIAHPSQDRIPNTITEVIFKLILEKFFSEPKTIGDIQRALQEKGFNMPTTSLSPILLRLLIRGHLKRSRKENGVWEYRAR